MLSLLNAVTLLAALTIVAARPATELTERATQLPTVDLGYVVQRATVFNDTGKYYNFSNIRYAQAPTGDLRFRAPQPPLKDRSVVRTGEIGRICPQANPAWLLIAEEFIPEYLQGKTEFSPSDFNTSSSGSGGLPAQDPRTTEDCLFLDVQVPKSIFDKRNGKKNKGAPVLVWIYGGGYTAGDKGGSGNPAGLIARSEDNGSSGIIYVALNYRLGAFGWLSGPTFQENGTANAALYDQRLAIEWVKQNIKKFGGDPNRITLIGESAGGGSIMHQITAYGGLKPISFQQAIPQSPGFQPFVSTVQQENIYNAYLTLLNVSTIEEARKLPYQTLQTANIIQVGTSAYGQFTYGPVVDGIFAPQLPGQLLAKGQFAKDVNVMVGHNADEGLLFTSPFNQNDSTYSTQLQSLLPSLPSFPQSAQYLENVLYPESDYPNQIARASATIAEAVFTCNTLFLDKAYKNKTYSYQFAVPPALHGNDVAYTYYNGANITSHQTAIALQEYITNFAMTGNPNGPGVASFPVYGRNASMNVLNVTGITQEVDGTANPRCEWWQKALYY
ncbi:Carboxylesterase patB [Pseudocercospora fuligena]|uniref:Carboxylic ester hydrolase n=1 Tax=Pseudocercospora fuligena TaxID=685502 RepID=A0A8H6RKG1_9PEZI|nr:Carboxylesterase patB [Pseudocercospora fuligena]